MKRLLYLSVFILLLHVPTVNADEIIRVSADRTAYDATWDKVVLNIIGIEVLTFFCRIPRFIAMLGAWSAERRNQPAGDVNHVVQQCEEQL